MENKLENQEQEELQAKSTDQEFSKAPKEDGEAKKDIKYRSYTLTKRLGIKR